MSRDPMTAVDHAAEDLISRLEQWPNHKTGADYSLAQVQDQQKEAAQVLRALKNRVEELKDALVEADLTIRSMPGTDQSHVEFIRSALTGSAQG